MSGPGEPESAKSLTKRRVFGTPFWPVWSLRIGSQNIAEVAPVGLADPKWTSAVTKWTILVRFGLANADIFTLSQKREAFLLTVGAFLFTVKLLCLQSLKALIRCTFPL